MARKLDQIVVIDVESTCWEGKPPDGQEREIIEIGICPVDVPLGERLGKEGILIRPERSELSSYCTELTGLTQADVDQGVSLGEACKLLRSKYKVNNRTWASYGDYDRSQFWRQCQNFDVKYPFGPTHLNVKNLFALITGRKREVGMAKALRIMSLPLEGTHHRAGDDAWNIGGILSRLLTALKKNNSAIGD